VEAEIKAAQPDATVELIQGSGGIFEVACDGKLIYSKKKTPERRFPNDGEVTTLLQKGSN
jgi:selT/selW/selH-like putative selenoprotein